jgi:hypothetical protein
MKVRFSLKPDGLAMQNKQHDCIISFDGDLEYQDVIHERIFLPQDDKKTAVEELF